jgi:hypothetical protein
MGAKKFKKEKVKSLDNGSGMREVENLEGSSPSTRGGGFPRVEKRRGLKAEAIVKVSNHK